MDRCTSALLSINSRRRVVGQRMIIAAGADVFELAGFDVVFFRIHALEYESLDFVGGVQRQPCP